jgi:phage FluMu protein Com
MRVTLVVPRAEARPVVKATLRCTYCAHVFTRDFSAADDIRSHLFLNGCSFPAPFANVAAVREYPQRTWYGRRYTEREHVRQTVQCPRCDHKTQIVRRESIAA